MDANAHGARCLVLLADPALGVISPSWRSKEALEEAGYAVFWFTPRLWPQLFADGVAQLGYLDALMRRWAVDAVVVADGLSIDTSACVVQAPRLVVLASREDELARSLERMRGAAPDTCWVLDGMAAPAAREQGCAVRTPGHGSGPVCARPCQRDCLPAGAFLRPGGDAGAHRAHEGGRPGDAGRHAGSLRRRGVAR